MMNKHKGYIIYIKGYGDSLSSFTARDNKVYLKKEDAEKNLLELLERCKSLYDENGKLKYLDTLDFKLPYKADIIEVELVY